MKTKLPTILALLLCTSAAHADDHGDTLQTATTITSPNTGGNLETTNDLDWFRLNVTVRGRHWLYTTGGTDTHGTLYDDAGNVLVSGGNYDDDGAGRNFYMSLILEAGTYYIRLANGGDGILTGAYVLSVRQPQTATPFNSPNLAASLGVLGDLDHYRIDVHHAGRIWCYTTGGTDTFGTLYDAGGNAILGGGNYDDDGMGRNFRFSDKLQPGTYFLLVSHGGDGVLTGDYTLSWRSPENAQVFAGADLERSLGVLGDLDLFRVTLSQVGPMWMYTTGDTDTYGVLYDCAGNSVAGGGNYDDDGAGYNFLFNASLQPETYFLLVENGGNGKLTGDYGLHLRDATRAVPLLQGGHSAHSIGSPGDLDLFVFATSGGTVRLETGGTTDTYGSIWDATGNRIISGGNYDNDGVGNNFLIPATLAAGQYYLLVSGANLTLVTGAYELDATFDAASLTRLSDAGIVLGSERSSSIDVSTTGAWSVGALPSWISASATGGSGPGPVTLSYAANLSGATREATITIGGQAYTITQRAAGDTAGQPVPAQMTIALGVVVTVPTMPGVTYRVQSSGDMQSWLDTGVVLQGDGSAQAVAFAQEEARAYFRAVPE